MRAAFVGVATVGFLLANIDGSASQEQRGANGQHQHESETGKGDGFSIPIRILKDPSQQQQADADAKKSERDEQRENENLAIQRSVAQSSEEVAQFAAPMFYVSIAGTALSMVTVLASACAAWFALGSVREARKATTVAEEALKAEREASRTSLRAYVGLVSVKMSTAYGEGALAVDITIKNAGQTPALISTIAKNIGGATTLLPHDMEAGEAQAMPIQIPPGESMNLHAANLTRIGDLREYVALGKFSIFVAVVIRYTDIFGEHHTTKFVRTIEGRRNIDGPFSPRPDYPDELS